MTAATEWIDTPEVEGKIVNIPVKAATTIYGGTLVAINTTTGHAEPAADAANLKVIGVAQADADNASGSAADIDVTVKRGVFGLSNDGTNPVSVVDLFQDVYVKDDQTVDDDGGTNNIVAGKLWKMDGTTPFIDTRYN